MTTPHYPAPDGDGSPTEPPRQSVFPEYPGMEASTEQPPSAAPIPAYAPPGVGPGAPAPMKFAQPLGVLATCLIVLSAIYTILEVGLAVFSFEAQRNLQLADDLGLSAFDTPFITYDLLGLPALAATIGGFVAAGLWLYRARTNAAILYPNTLQSRKALWSWFGWIVPIVSFWFPFQIVRDSIPHRRAGEKAPPFAAWWTFWIIGVVASNISDRLSINTSLADGLATMHVISAGATVIALYFWVRVIREVTAEQEASRLQQLQAAPPVPGWPPVG